MVISKLPDFEINICEKSMIFQLWQLQNFKKLELSKMKPQDLNSKNKKR
jgi:hypothetical protein